MEQFAKIRMAGVPLVCWESSDPGLTIKACRKALNGAEEKIPLMQWTVLTGLTGLNEAGLSVMQASEIDSQGTLNPAEFLNILVDKASQKNTSLKDSVIFVHMANRIIEEYGPCQGFWLCRDIFKARGITMVLLGPAFTLPDELKQDVIVISEPLPDAEALEKIATSLVADAGLKTVTAQATKEMPKIVDTLRGLSGFAAEQVLAMSMSKEGIDMPALMKLKRSYISQTPGVEVREDKITFEDIAGYDNVKKIMKQKIGGKRPPRLILWLDELEKALAGGEGDNTGVTQDQIGTILQWMQDRLNEDRLSAALFVGFAGTGKSALSMALRNESQCECLRMDLGGMKESLVGSSEKRIRNVLKVVDAMSGGHILVVGTCNSAGNLPSPLISRFALGTYMFDLPAATESEALWKIKRKKYRITDDQPNPTENPWTGREVNQCCFLADDLQIPLKDAAQYITPFCATNAAEIDSLRKQAHNRWLSASTPGFYRMPQAAALPDRKMNLK